MERMEQIEESIIQRNNRTWQSMRGKEQGIGRSKR